MSVSLYVCKSVCLSLCLSRSRSRHIPTPSQDEEGRSEKLDSVEVFEPEPSTLTIFPSRSRPRHIPTPSQEEGGRQYEEGDEGTRSDEGIADGSDEEADPPAGLMWLVRAPP